MGFGGAKMGSSVSEIDEVALANALKPHISDYIDERIDKKLEGQVESRESELERLSRDMTDAMRDMQLELKQEIHTASMGTRDRVFRYELLELMPKLEQWIRDLLAANGVAPPMPSIPIRPPA